MVFLGNLFISIIGFVFIYGAPVVEHNKKLKLFFSLFWLALSFYYIARIGIGTLGQMRGARMIVFINPSYDFSISRSHWAWMFLVILADVSILMLCIGHYFHNLEKIRSPKLVVASIFVLFVLVWAIDSIVGNNALSSAVAFLVFFYTAWSCRIVHISSSILWIIYAFLHLPIGIATVIPFEWRRSIFVLLFATKLSLVVAMYNMLEVKKSKDSG